MKTFLITTSILFTLVAACKNTPVKETKVLYISENYVCEGLIGGVNVGPILSDCTSLLTGYKVKEIYNATNIRVVE